MMLCRRYALVLALVACHGIAVAQFNTTALVARISAMGGCFFAMPSGQFVSFDYRSVSLLPELAQKSILLAIRPSEQSSILSAYHQSGDSDYSEQQFSMAYAMSVADGINLGVAAAYCYAGGSDAMYSSEQFVQASIFGKYKASQRLSLHAVLTSTPWREARYCDVSVGFSFNPSPDWFTIAEVWYTDVLSAHYGIEYTYLSVFKVRAGFCSAPLSIAFGLGIEHRSIRIDLSSQYYQYLGLTPQATLSVCF